MRRTCIANVVFPSHCVESDCRFTVRENNTLFVDYTMSDVSLKQSCELYEFIICTVIVGMLVVVGIIGNSLVFAVFWKGKFNKSTSFLFMCLSLTDSAVLLSTLVFISLRPFVEYTGYKQYFRSVLPYTFVYVLPLCLMAQTATLWVTVLITVNRYIHVCLPLRAAQWCTITKMKVQLAVVFLFAILYNIPKFAEFRVQKVASENGTSFTMSANTTRLFFDYTYQVMYNSVLYAIFTLLPTCIMALLNIRLIKALKHMRTLHSQNDNSMTFVLMIIVIVLIVCQLPALVTRMLWIAASEGAYRCGGYMFYIVPVTNMLVVLNSAVNFVIYIMFNKRFRNVLMEKVFKRHATQQVVIFDSNAGAAVMNTRLGVDER